MNNDVIRVGIVGAGANTKLKHIPGLQALNGVEIVSVANRSRESSERVAQEFAIPKTYDSWKELVEAPDTNAIVIGTWPYLHCRVTMAALTFGKHVLCEARMAMNAREAKLMRDAAVSRPDLIAQIVPAPHTLPVDNTVKRLIREGYLGDILAAEVRITTGEFLNPETPLHWRNDFDRSGFNVMSLGIWYEAIMRWIGEATQIAVMGKTFVKQRLDTEKGIMRTVRIPEHIVVMAEMACGAQMTITVSSIMGENPTSRITLFGSQGTLRFDDGKLYGRKQGEDELQKISIPTEESGEWRVEEEFVSSIRGTEIVTHTTFDDGVKYMEFTEAVARSMSEQRMVSLPLIPYY
jgi:predicted dehydrogenase